MPRADDRAQILLTEPAEKSNRQPQSRDSGLKAAPYSGGRHPVLHVQRTLGNRRTTELILSRQLTPQGRLLARRPLGNLVQRYSLGDFIDDAESVGSSAVEGAKQAGSAVVEGVKEAGSAVVEGAKEVGSAAVEGVKGAGSAVVEGAKGVGSAVVEGAKEIGTAAEAGLDQTELAGMARAEVTNQVARKTPKELGFIDELNDLENFREDNGVPATVPTFSGLTPDQLSTKIGEEELLIASLDSGRIAICKKARADARLALENAKNDILEKMLSTAVITGIIMGVVTKSGAATVIGALVAALVSEYVAESKARDAVKAILAKAKEDLKVANTNIRIEKIKLDAMKKAQPPVINVNDLPNVPEPPAINPNDLPNVPAR